MASRSLDESVQRELDRFTAAQSDHGAAFKRLRERFREYIPGKVCGPAIVRRVQQRLAQGRAASFIRLGDADGNVLAFGMDSYPALTAYCAREVSIEQFGTPDVLLQAGVELQQALGVAIRNAELLGFPTLRAMPSRLKECEQGSVHPRHAYGVGTVNAYLERFAESLELASKTGSVSGFNTLLLPHYRVLIEGRDIGLVSCHEQLAVGLRNGMGARGVTFYQVPEQASPAFTTASGDTGHYPARYHALLHELGDAQAGILYLVAAGPLGKIYCEAIRAAGGIALDVGAVADIWAGVRSRRHVMQETVDKWRTV